MATFVISDAYTNVVQPSLELRKHLVDLLAARPQGFQFSPKFRRGQWDGFVSLFKDSKFPTGLWPIVQNHLTEIEFDDYEVDDLRADLVTREAVTQLVNGYELYDYQEAAVKAVLANGHGVLKMATNAGKTLVAASLWLTLNKPKTLYVVPWVELLEQTSRELAQYTGANVGTYGGGTKVSSESITITTIKSLPNVIKHLRGVNLVIVDECHRTKSSTVFDNIFKVSGRYRVGMSGTPLTHSLLSDLKLVAATGPIIYEITNTELIESGYSTPPHIKFLEVSCDWDKSLTQQEAYRRYIVNYAPRNVQIAQVCRDFDEPVLIICNWIEHAESLLTLLDDAIYLTGNNTRQERQEGLAKFKRDGGVLLCTPIFGEGINMPDVGVIILAAGMKSHIQLLQRIGRGMRIAKDKDKVIIIDFIDDTNQYLFKHSEVRYDVYKNEGFNIGMYNE